MVSGPKLPPASGARTGHAFGGFCRDTHGRSRDRVRPGPTRTGRQAGALGAGPDVAERGGMAVPGGHTSGRGRAQGRCAERPGLTVDGRTGAGLPVFQRRDRRDLGRSPGSPPSPPPRSIRPSVRRLPRSPRLSGPGPHRGRPPIPPYSAASDNGAAVWQISRNCQWSFSRSSLR